MTDDLLSHFLTKEAVDAATLQHATRYLVNELALDRPRALMLDELHGAAGDGASVETGLVLLSTDSDVLFAANIAVISAVWDDGACNRDRVRGAILDAKTRLPVVEIAVIALASMYGLYLTRTGGKLRTRRRVERRADGTWLELEEVDYADPTGPLQALGELIAKFGSSE